MIIKLFIVSFGAFILDGLVLPAFFGFRESFLSVLLLILPILYLGFTKRCIIYGLSFSIILESFKGLNFGTLVMPFLLTAAIIYLIQRFLDIKYTYDTRFDLSKSVIIALASAAFFYMFLFFYKWGDINIEYFNAITSLTVILEAIILIFIFNIIFNKKCDYVS